jgi:orotate phosphoribosyltransferase
LTRTCFIDKSLSSQGVLSPVFLAPPTDPIKSFFHSVGVIIYRIFPIQSTIFATHKWQLTGRQREALPAKRIIMKKELIRLLCEKSFQYSKEPTFKLASGKMSRFYVNCKPVTLSPKGMYLIGHLVFDAISDIAVAGVGGLTFGADPIAMATSFVSEIKKKPFKAFSIRKNQKDHGIIKWIEGDLSPGDRVAIVEDVVTTGGSTIKAIERARVEGLKVERIIVLVDRQEGGVAAIQELVPEVVSLITRDELLEVYSE